MPTYNKGMPGKKKVVEAVGVETARAAKGGADAEHRNAVGRSTMHSSCELGRSEWDATHSQTGRAAGRSDAVEIPVKEKAKDKMLGRRAIADTSAAFNDSAINDVAEGKRPNWGGKVPSGKEIGRRSQGPRWSWAE